MNGREERGMTNDDELLRGLRARANEQREDADLDPDVLRELERPLDEAADDRIAEAILARDGRASEPARPEDEGERVGRPRLRVIRGGASHASTIEPPRATKVEPRRSLLLRAAPLLVAAAALVLFFVWPRGTVPGLPRYAFELAGNVAETRADGPKVVEARAKVHVNANLEIVLRPDSPVAVPVKAKAILVRDGKAQAWTPPMQVSGEGAVRIAGPVKMLFPDVARPWEILVAVGPQAQLPADPDAMLAAASAGREGIRIARGVVEFVGSDQKPGDSMP